MYNYETLEEMGGKIGGGGQGGRGNTGIFLEKGLFLSEENHYNG